MNARFPSLARRIRMPGPLCLAALFLASPGAARAEDAFADVETGYICRGYVWDTRPYSAQYADAVVDFDAFARDRGDDGA